jgi:predicted oxidoreductase
VRQSGLFVELASPQPVVQEKYAPPATSQNVGIEQLILGCASMLGYTDRASAMAALANAMRLGIRQFDVARSYGYGQAERLLGDFFAAHRAEVRITSKYGIAPASGMRANAIRVLRGRMGGLRHLRFFRGANARDANGTFWSPSEILKGLEQSLRELRTDYLDEFLLHSPPAELADRDEVFRALDTAQRNGKVVKFGVCTDAQTALAFLSRVQTAQISFNLEHAPMPPKLRAFPKSINHIFGGRGGIARMMQRLKDTHVHAPEIESALFDAPEKLNEAIVRVSLRAAGAQSAVISMNNVQHQARNVAAVLSPTLNDPLIEHLVGAFFLGAAHA